MHKHRIALALYLALLLAPLVLGQVLARQAGWAVRPWRDDLASGLAMVGLAALFVEFVLLGRFKPLSWRLGSDWLMQAHQLFARTALGLLAAHPLLYSLWGQAALPWDTSHALSLRVPGASWGLLSGLLALVLLGALVLQAVHRDSQRHERWRVVHAALALAVVALGLHHTLTLGRYAQLPAVQALWWVLAAGAAASLAWVHGVRPLLQRRHPYRLQAVQRVADRIWALDLQPGGPDAAPGATRPGLRHRAGQFAWLRLAGAGSHADNPLCVASAPRADGGLRLLVKEAGDFTRGIGRLPPGQVLFLDGPYGRFTLPGDDRPVVMLAGGIGVAPFLALLQAAAAAPGGPPERAGRSAPAAARPLRLVYADRDASQVVDVPALAGTARLADFALLRVLERPGAAADANTSGSATATAKDAATLPGRLDAAGLDAVLRHPAIAPLKDRAHFMVCGPPGMMDAVEAELTARGVPPGRLHAEHFQYALRSRSPLARQARALWLGGSAALVAGVGLVLLLR